MNTTARTEYLSAQEILNILAEAKRQSARLHLICLLGYRHGLRVSEIASLTLADVQHGRIDVRRVKGSKRTIQPLQSHANSLLDEPAALAAWLKARGDAYGSQFLFTSRQGGGLSTRQIENLFEGVAIRAGIDADRRNIHGLKHAICSHLIRAGMTIEYVQIWVGHADLKSTAYYLHISQHEAGAKAAQTLSNVFAVAA
jgi:type 1 fimbriae regulatory protein FimB